MSTIDAFDDFGIDPKTESKADYGPSAQRKAALQQATAPMHVLDAHGVDVPGQEFHPEDHREYPTTAEIDGVRVHLHQDVKERDDGVDAFGDFGAAEDDDVIWTVVDLTDETVTLKVVGEWSKSREVPFGEFAEEYEPLHLSDGQPQWGY